MLGSNPQIVGPGPRTSGFFNPRGQYLTSPTVWSETDGFLTVIDRKVVMPEK
jgi:hypothetical protein